jgi:hypothetical protein
LSLRLLYPRSRRPAARCRRLSLVPRSDLWLRLWALARPAARRLLAILRGRRGNNWDAALAKVTGRPSV